MSSRKKAKHSNKQPQISSFFSTRTKPSAVPSPPKRLAQTSLTVRPVRSKIVSEDDEVLDLTRSTSPSREDSESPPSTKKRRIGAGPVRTDRVTRQTAHHSLFDSNMSPLSKSSSPAPSQPITPTKLQERVKAMAISPTPVTSRTQRQSSMMMIDDPNDNEVVESSQTQYINLQFTPPVHRTLVNVPAPISTPPSHHFGSARRPTSVNRASHDTSTTTPGLYEWHIPSSQGEVTEPRTPRKRAWGAISQSGSPSKGSATTVVASSTVSNSLGERSQMPPPMLPASATRTDNGTGALPETKTNGLSKINSKPSSGRVQPTYPQSDDRLDHIPSSQGEPSLPPTELGTMQSPQRPAPYPGIDTDLLTTIPSSNPASQEALTTKKQPIAPVPRPDFAPPPHTSTPSHTRTMHREIASSPTDLPSPRALMESLGVGVGTQGNSGLPTPTPRTIEHGQLDFSSAVRQMQAHLQDSPERGDISSQTIVPSSQPAHDSSPPPEYAFDAESHSLNQAQIQQRPPRGGDHARSSQEGHYPRSSQDGSSQPLPPSQTSLRTSRVNPNQSGAGMHGVFGMLGFGSEAETCDGSPIRNMGKILSLNERMHILATGKLPPSSPPPETPPRSHEPRTFPQGSTKNPKSPLLLAFAQAQAKDKTTTPAKLRAGPVVATPSRQDPDTQTQSSSVVEDSQLSTRKKAHSRSQSVGLRSGSGSTALKRTRTRKLRPTTPNQQTLFDMAAKPSPSARLQRALFTPTRTPLSKRQQEIDIEFVESSDAEEEAMEKEARTPLLNVATSPARGFTRQPAIPSSTPKTPGRGKGKENAYAVVAATPVAVGRVPSSVSPSPALHSGSPSPTGRLSPPCPTRYSSPSPLAAEDTQTQDELETPWETLRPSQSVSQVLERRIMEEAMTDAERVRLKRVEQERNKREEQERQDRERKEAAEKEKAAKPPPIPPLPTPARPTAVPVTFSTPKSHRITDKEIYVVTPAKSGKRGLVTTQQNRVGSMTPSSPMDEDQGEDGEQYTYVDETFNPTESQISFLNRIMHSSSEME